jgi:uncharacterized protein (DUF58 family)
MNSRLSVKSYFYMLVVVACVVVFGLIWRTDLLFFCAPFGVALIRGLSRASRPKIRADRSISAQTAFEGDRIICAIEIRAISEISLVEFLAPLPADAVILKGSNHIVAQFAAGQTRRYACHFSIPVRRSITLESLELRLFDPHGFYTYGTAIGSACSLVIFPMAPPIRSLVAPAHTQVYTGNYPSRSDGEGVEFASIRGMQSGDRLSSVNWRATARRGELHVNQYVVERNADVVLLIDTFADASIAGRVDGSVASPSSLDLAVRCASTVADHYIRDKNRVGLIEFGFYLSYVTPATGRRQWYRILDRLASLQALKRSVTYDISTVPRRILSSRSLIIAFTALLDDRFDAALFDLKHRGFDVAVFVVSGAPPLRLGTDSETSTISRMLWERERQNRIDRLARGGLSVSTWSTKEPIDLTLRRINAMRRKLR